VGLYPVRVHQRCGREYPGERHWELDQIGGAEMDGRLYRQLPSADIRRHTMAGTAGVHVITVIDYKGVWCQTIKYNTCIWFFRLKSNWWKGKPSGSIACTRKQQPRFYWSCSSVVMNGATPKPLLQTDKIMFYISQMCTVERFEIMKYYGYVTYNV